MANTDIKWFSFENTNAPQLSNTWGCLVDVLDACLVTGFGSQLVSSITIENGVAVATFGSAHNFKQFQVVEISGADQNELNSEFKIIGLSVNTIEFLVDPTEQNVTGVISCKLASLGWTKAFSGTQKAVYQAKDTVANPYFLRVDNSRDPIYSDSYAKFAKVGILEYCTNIDDVTSKQAPFDSSAPNKNWTGEGSGGSARVGWSKWYYATHNNIGKAFDLNETLSPTNGNRDWFIIGNESSFYILPMLGNDLTVPSFLLYGFGVVCSVITNNNLPFLSSSINDGYTSTTVQLASSLGVGSGMVMLLNDSDYIGEKKFGSSKLPFSMAYSGNIDYFKKPQYSQIMISNFHMIDDLNNYIGEFPLLMSSMLIADEFSNKVPFNDNGNALIKFRFLPKKGIIGCIFFKLGEYYA